jgi:diguanylate cyclase (GGDEF)-like protein
MRIATITNWAYGVTILLTALSGGAFILSARSAAHERSALQQHIELGDLAEELSVGSDETTDQANLFVIRGESRHFNAFKQASGEDSHRDATIKNLKSFGISPQEYEIIEDVAAKAEALDQFEDAAVMTYQNGDQDGAKATLFGPEHERLQTALLAGISAFRSLSTLRTTTTVAEAQRRSDFWSTCAKLMLGLTAAVFLGVLYFVLRRRIAIPLTRMTGIVNRLALQDYAVEVPSDHRRDEIGDMNDAIQIFRTNGIERDRLGAVLRQDQETKDVILQMMHRLQGCQSQVELAEVVALFAPRIFPGLAGSLYIMNESRTVLTRLNSWLDPQHSQYSFPATACWGLRRGRPHVSDHHHGDIPCQHLDGTEASGLCVPLTAQADAIGLLYFEEQVGGQAAVNASRLYLELIAENIGLAVANLQLREKLVNLAVRDGLTGLFNRRSLDEALNHLKRERPSHQLICMMVDIDHFKRFNDESGHDAGDEVLRYVAQIIRDRVGSLGLVYRFGGEEFTVLCEELADEQGFELAETLRKTVFGTPLTYRGRIVAPVSISIGVASSPTSGGLYTLLNRADAALLEAKTRGRNMTVSACSLGNDTQATR